MVFHRARIKRDKYSFVSMNNVCLNTTESIKYLGIIIDHKLNWTSHIAHVKIQYPKVLVSCSEQGIMSLKSV